MNMYESKKMENTFLSVVFTKYNVRVDKEKVSDLSIPELWTGLTMKSEKRKLYKNFIEAAVIENYQKDKRIAEINGKDIDCHLARVSRFLTAEAVL